MAYHHHSPSERRRILRAKGKKPISFRPGALHEQLGVPSGKPIPPGKRAAALAGELGPLAKKRATFAFRGALAAGRSKASAKARRLARKLR